VQVSLKNKDCQSIWWREWMQKPNRLGSLQQNSWKLGWQPDTNVKADVAASAQNEKMGRKITSTSAPKAGEDCRKSEE